MKIILHRKKCIGCGSCSAICPEHFELDENGLASLKGAIKKNEEQTLEIKQIELGCIKETSEICPVQVIEIVD